MNTRNPSWIVFLCLALPWAYWIYLALNTHMVLAQDALAYHTLGRLIADQGFFPQYFIQGPNREPIYPLMVAFAMKMEFWFHIPFASTMHAIGLACLLSAQLCLLRILQILKIHPLITCLTLLYFGFSPAITNSAFSLYSEIAVIPFIMPLILVFFYYQQAHEHKRPHIYSLAILLAVLLFLLTMVKASFEIITPALLILLNVYIAYQHRQQLGKILVCFILSLGLWFTGVHFYKNLNKEYTGQYCITNRASWALYGNTARRMQPLNTERLLSALAYVGGDGLCRKFFSQESCDFWSYKTSDSYGMEHLSHLAANIPDQNKLNKVLMQESKTLIQENPWQYMLFYILEGIKLCFWESTQIGFVDYPAWLTSIYEHSLFNNVLRLCLSLFTLFALAIMLCQLCSKNTPFLMRGITVLIMLYTLTYSFFFILPRYALPIAPLFLICIAYFANFLYNTRHAKNKRHP